MPSNYQKTLVVPKNEFGTPHVSVPIYYFGNSLRSKQSSATKCTPVEGLEPPATRLKAERSDPLSYTSEGSAYCWRIHRLLRIYARVETARTILWEPACSGWSVPRTKCEFELHKVR